MLEGGRRRRAWAGASAQGAQRATRTHWGMKLPCHFQRKMAMSRGRPWLTWHAGIGWLLIVLFDCQYPQRLISAASLLHEDRLLLLPFGKIAPAAVHVVAPPPAPPLPRSLSPPPLPPHAQWLPCCACQLAGAEQGVRLGEVELGLLQLQPGKPTTPSAGPHVGLQVGLQVMRQVPSAVL